MSGNTLEIIGMSMLATFMLWGIPFNHWYATDITRDITIKGAILMTWLIVGFGLMIAGDLRS